MNLELSTVSISTVYDTVSLGFFVFLDYSTRQKKGVRFFAVFDL